MKKNILKLWITLFSLLLFSLCKGATYYVSNSSGNDSNSGLSSKQPWKTLANVSDQSFKPGDSILLKRGDTWRETLFIPSSGSPSKKIIFSSFGSGEFPVILGSEQVSKWTNLGENIWKSEAVFKTNPYSITGEGSGNLWTINTDLTVNTGIYKTNLTNLTAQNNWCYNSNSIYLYSTSNPAIQYKSVEISSRSAGIFLKHKEYIEINGINIFYAGVGIYESTTPESEDVKGLIVRNCELGYFGYPNGSGIGIHAFYSNSLFENNIIHDCGRRGISLCVVTNTFKIKNVVIQNNSFYHGYHTTSVDLQGTTAYTGGCDSIFIRNNYIYDLPNYSPPAYPMQMFVSDQGANNLMTNIFIYNNIFKYSAGAAINIDGIENLNIYNNTFYGHNNTTKLQSSFLFISKSFVNVKNNIFYTQLYSDKSDNGLAYVLTDKDMFSRLNSDYNCYFRTSANLPLIKCANPYFTFETNNFSNLQSNYGWETNAILKDPKFISSSDLSLQPTSPCIGKGINVGLPYNGEAPNIGAIPSSSFLSDQAGFLSYSIFNQVGNTLIDFPQKTIKMTVPFGTVLNNLIAKFSVSPGATVKVGSLVQVSGSTSNNYTTTITYKVFAQDRITVSEWKVTVTVAQNTKSEITAFSIQGQITNTVIDALQKTIKLTVPSGTKLNSLVAKFSVSPGATVKVGNVAQVSEITANDFSTTITYKVFAQDGITVSDWKVTVAVAPSTKSEITAFSIQGQTGNTVIDPSSHSISITMPHEVSLANLITSFVISSGASAFVNDGLQTNNLTQNNFTNPVIYKVVAQDGVTFTNWTINVKNESSALPLEVEQIINLKAGWNIISFNVLPDKTDIKDILQPLIQSGKLIKVQDEEGNFMVNTMDGWYSNLKDLDVTKGYNIKVTENTQLITSGQ